MLTKALYLLIAFAFVLRADEPADPIAAYKSGEYARALPLLQQAVAKNPKDALLQAALLSTLVYQGHVDDASDAADEDADNFPQSPEVIAARGEFSFYMGDMPSAERLFKAALKIKDETPRAYYGLYRLYFAASMYRSARLFCLRAHELDPNDALITMAFIRYLVPEKRKEMLPDFIKAHPWFYTSLAKAQANSSDVNEELNGRKVFELDSARQEVTIPIHYLHDGTRIRGMGIDVAIGNNKPVLLLLDTGASGLLLTQAAIDKAGLSHIGSFDIHGVGDKGARNTFISVADTCTIGTLKYKTCLIRATEGKQRIADESDGLMGMDFFSDYIITIDFYRHTLHLVPLPDRPPSPQGYNREPLPTEAGFTPVYRFGHHLDVSTIVNGKATGLFLIDTGSNLSAIDSTFARLSTKIHGNEYMHVRGVSGSVKDVFEADKAELQFSRFRQSNLGLTSFNLNNGNEHQEVRMDGILGFSVLTLFRLTLDYRNGLVNFEYSGDLHYKP